MRDVLQAHTDLIGVEASAELSGVPGATRATLLRRSGSNLVGLKGKGENWVGQENRHLVRDMYPLHTQRRRSICTRRKKSSCDCQLANMQRVEVSIRLRSEDRREANRR